MDIFAAIWRTAAEAADDGMKTGNHVNKNLFSVITQSFQHPPILIDVHYDSTIKAVVLAYKIVYLCGEMGPFISVMQLIINPFVEELNTVDVAFVDYLGNTGYTRTTISVSGIFNVMANLGHTMELLFVNGNYQYPNTVFCEFQQVLKDASIHNSHNNNIIKLI